MSRVSGERKLDMLKELNSIFRPERVVHLCVTLVSAVVLLTCGVIVAVKDQSRYPELTGLFGSTGALTYTTGKILSMWDKALKVIFSASS